MGSSLIYAQVSWAFGGVERGNAASAKLVAAGVEILSLLPSLPFPSKPPLFIFTAKSNCVHTVYHTVDPTIRVGGRNLCSNHGFHPFRWDLVNYAINVTLTNRETYSVL